MNRYTEYLSHYGILGMKWGVRRYQNSDGSYTREGLKRYSRSMSNYEQATSELKRAKSGYKTGVVSKNELVKAKSEQKKSKDKLNRDYRQLKKDYLGDQGKELYSQGKTITKNNNQVAYLGAAATFGALGSTYIRQQQANILSSMNNEKLSNIGYLASAGMAVTAGILKTYGNYEAKRLRAYYGHSRPKD